ncbi:MAG TPA: hypothetical protein VJ891_01285 [Casimicrobiaceae bacterium]|nr:hypothetical protein [Casimicrobiaceae bacterium]
MMQCRMCSQRLTRPGKLCRECEHELDRARYSGMSIDALVAQSGGGEASRLAEPGWLSRVRSPANIVAIAFAIGVGSAGLVHVVGTQLPSAPVHSVMPDVDEPTPVRGIAFEAAAPSPATRVAPQRHKTTIVHAPITAPEPITAVAAPHGPETTIAFHATGTRVASVSSQGAALDMALAHCSEERFFARPGCQQRARARYCVGDASDLAQCARPARDYGE